MSWAESSAGGCKYYLNDVPCEASITTGEKLQETLGNRPCVSSTSVSISVAEMDFILSDIHIQHIISRQIFRFNFEFSMWAIFNSNFK